MATQWIARFHVDKSVPGSGIYTANEGAEQGFDLQFRTGRKGPVRRLLQGPAVQLAFENLAGARTEYGDADDALAATSLEDVAVVMHSAVTAEGQALEFDDDIARGEADEVGGGAGLDRPNPDAADIAGDERLTVHPDPVVVLACFQRVKDRESDFEADGEELVERQVAGVDNANHLTVFVDERSAAVAGVDGGVVLEDLVDGGPAGLAVGIELGDDPANEGVLGFAERVAGGEDAGADGQVAVVELKVRVCAGRKLDDGQVGAFAGGDDAGVDRLATAGDVDVEGTDAGDNMVGNDNEAVGADEEAGTLTDDVLQGAEFGVGKGDLRDDADRGGSDAVEAGGVGC